VTRLRSKHIEMPPTTVALAPAEKDYPVVDEDSEKVLNIYHWFFELVCKTRRAISVRKRQLDKGAYLIRIHDSELTPALIGVRSRLIGRPAFSEGAECISLEPT
jgi:hypothetical protein